MRKKGESVMKKMIKKLTTWTLVFGMTFTPVFTNINLVAASAEEEEETITFVSDRQSVSLSRQEILYVESCDTEVWVHATEGRRFRNKTTISSWERLLGAEYLRIHRSFLVRLSACTGLEHDNVILGDERLPISRKYKEAVQERFKDALL